MKYGLTSIDNIPYLNKTQLEGRFVNTVFYDDDQWHMYTNTSSGLIKMHVIDAKETIYFAKEPALDTDFYYYTLDFLSQHANYMFIRKSFKGLTDDIYNLSTSLYKIRFFENSDALVGYQQVIITELEYFFIVCRSLFDLMQDVISQLWHNISLSDTTIRKSEIPKSFNSMLKCQTIEEMMLKYGLPLDLAQCYFKHKSFFHNLKTLRDNIVHNGSRLDVIYKEDTKGFFVSKQFKPFDKYPIWLSDEVKPNELVPLIPALEYFIYKILAAFDSFSIILGRVIKWPAKVTKDMYLFMRGDHTYCLNESIQSTTCRIKKQDIIIDMAISNYLKKSKPNLHYNNPRLI